MEEEQFTSISVDFHATEMRPVVVKLEKTGSFVITVRANLAYPNQVSFYFEGLENVSEFVDRLVGQLEQMRKQNG